MSRQQQQPNSQQPQQTHHQKSSNSISNSSGSSNNNNRSSSNQQSNNNSNSNHENSLYRSYLQQNTTNLAAVHQSFQKQQQQLSSKSIMSNASQQVMLHIIFNNLKQLSVNFSFQKSHQETAWGSHSLRYIRCLLTVTFKSCRLVAVWPVAIICRTKNRRFSPAITIRLVEQPKGILDDRVLFNIEF